MKIGVFTALFGERDLETTLDYVAGAGVQMVELGTGNYPGNPHCNLDELLGNRTAQKALLKAVESRGLGISALSCHGNPLHPDKAFAKANHEVHRKTVQLAQELGIGVVVNFSGCPGDGPNATKPNWVTCPWPKDYSEILEWQWGECVIPYWKEETKFAKSHNVKVALEMHPGFCVYNVETMLKLRYACDDTRDTLGCNFDPSHLFWNGVDPIRAILALGQFPSALYHVHAKDCGVNEFNVAVNGCNDAKPYDDEVNRSWIFRTVGYGHDHKTWKDIVGWLRLMRYDFVLSIEHEDGLMSVNEGFTKAVSFLKEILMNEKPGLKWWT